MIKTIHKTAPSDTDTFILVSKQSFIVNHESNTVFHSLQTMNRYTLSDADYLYLGEFDQQRYYVAESMSDNYETVSFRSQLDTLSPTHYSIFSRALQLITWRKQHRFCGQCGDKTREAFSELALYCDRCELSFYSKISPCMMCLVTKGDYCLLAHHESHPDGLYSTLAGFVEAGETLEQTIVR